MKFTCIALAALAAGAAMAEAVATSATLPVRGAGRLTDITVDSFARICRDAKRFSDETGVRMLQVGPLDEWGEGSIGYPNSQHGFGMLEAVRDTFGKKPEGGWPVNYAPVDVGLGPYTAPYVAQP